MLWPIRNNQQSSGNLEHTKARALKRRDAYQSNTQARSHPTKTRGNHRNEMLDKQDTFISNILQEPATRCFTSAMKPARRYQRIQVAAHKESDERNSTPTIKHSGQPSRKCRPGVLHVSQPEQSRDEARTISKLPRTRTAQKQTSMFQTNLTLNTGHSHPHRPSQIQYT